MTKRKPMSRLDILNAEDVTVVKKPIKAWNGREVCFRDISGEQALEYNEFVTQTKKDQPEITNRTALLLGIRLLTYMLCDEQGNLLFTEADIEALAKKSFVAVQELIEIAMELAGMKPDAVAEAKDKLKNAPSESLPINSQES